jgi:hypothetical protein
MTPSLREFFFKKVDYEIEKFAIFSTFGGVRHWLLPDLKTRL